jgi:hypothetical protein
MPEIQKPREAVAVHKGGNSLANSSESSSTTISKPAPNLLNPPINFL